MPATAADISAGSREASVASWSSATIAARYSSARDGAAQPGEGFCDAIADAQTLADARGGLIGVERRRFAVVAHSTIWPDLSTGVPTAMLIDTEHNANGAFLAARFEIDLDAGVTNLELFG